MIESNFLDININFYQIFLYSNNGKIILQYIIYGNNIIVKNLDIIKNNFISYINRSHIKKIFSVDLSALSKSDSLIL